MTTAFNELVSLRVSVARIAQVCGVDNQLGVTNAPIEELQRLAINHGRGWNSLAAMVCDAIESLLNDNAALTVELEELGRRGDGGPPYDAATATGMYDHDDVN